MLYYNLNMESANRIIAVLLGLLVVLFIVAAILGKIGFLNIKGPITDSPVGKALGLRQPSPTPTSKVAKKETNFVTIKETASTENKLTPTAMVSQNGDAGSQTGTTKGGQPVETIPATGAPMILYPLAIAGMGFGFYLRKKS